MRQIYSFILYLLTPYLFLRLWWKGRCLPAYRERIGERFCFGKFEQCTFDVWIHAVSLGEVIAATPLVEALLTNKRRVLVTTMTPTGAAQVANHFKGRVVHRYLPYDLPVLWRRFFKANQPRVLVIMETEMWPNLIAAAKKLHVPLLLVNARLSERSFKGYKHLTFLFKPLLNQFNAILTQSPEDAARFQALGADASRVSVFGNIKFDSKTQNINKKPYIALKNIWGSHRLVFIAASTHDDEEQQILQRLKTLQSKIPNIILLIAPRHPERFQAIVDLSLQLGFKTGRRSQITTLNEDVEVVILDSLGELLGFYHISDYAFVGGSLVPVGGHNVLEPIAMGVPVLTGPFVNNFKAICSSLKEANAIELVDNVEVLFERLVTLNQDTIKKNCQVGNAHHVLQANKGALDRYLAKVESFLN